MQLLTPNLRLECLIGWEAVLGGCRISCMGRTTQNIYVPRHGNNFTTFLAQIFAPLRAMSTVLSPKNTTITVISIIDNTVKALRFGALYGNGSIFSVELNTLLESKRDSGCDVTFNYIPNYTYHAYSCNCSLVGHTYLGGWTPLKTGKAWDSLVPRPLPCSARKRVW